MAAPGLVAAVLALPALETRPRIAPPCNISPPAVVATIARSKLQTGISNSIGHRRGGFINVG